MQPVRSHQKYLRIRLGVLNIIAVCHHIKVFFHVSLLQDQSGILTGGAYCQRKI